MRAPSVIALAILAGIGLAPRPAEAQVVQAGALTCDVAPGFGFLVGSRKEIVCTFRNVAGDLEIYDGSARRRVRALAHAAAGLGLGPDGRERRGRSGRACSHPPAGSGAPALRKAPIARDVCRGPDLGRRFRSARLSEGFPAPS